MFNSTSKKRLTLGVPLTVLILLGACASPERPAPAETAGGAGPVEAKRLVADPQHDDSTEKLLDDHAVNEQPAQRRSGGSLDSEDLVGLGELGLLPALLESFGTSIDCDFDDALSTCQ
ncbi:MAG: hypothetical protein GY719_21675 [bacterium]|nr:hypothetical protein [bacterium]